jgi:hypothetical protein
MTRPVDGLISIDFLPYIEDIQPFPTERNRPRSHYPIVLSHRKSGRGSVYHDRGTNVHDLRWTLVRNANRDDRKRREIVGRAASRRDRPATGGHPRDFLNALRIFFNGTMVVRF